MIQATEMIFRMVEAAHLRSTCDKEAQGAVILHGDKVVVGIGWTHSVGGQPNCTASGHDIVPVRRMVPSSTGMGGKVWAEFDECVRPVVKGELAALLQAGNQARGATLYCSRIPGWVEAVAVVAAGISRVHVAIGGGKYDRERELFRTAAVDFILLEVEDESP